MRALTPDGKAWLGLCGLHGLESGVFRFPPRLVIETCEHVADDLGEIAGARIRVLGGLVQVDGISRTDPGYQRARTLAQREKRVVIRVSDVDLLELRASMRRQLGEIPGVQIRLQGDAVIVEGDLQSRADLERVRAVTEPRGERIPDVFDLVRLDPEAILKRYPH